jgi:hypothetical protein
VRKSEGRRPPGRRRYKWEDNIKMMFKKYGMPWIGFIWLWTGSSGWLIFMVINLLVP